MLNILEFMGRINPSTMPHHVGKASRDDRLQESSYKLAYLDYFEVGEERWNLTKQERKAAKVHGKSGSLAVEGGRRPVPDGDYKYVVSPKGSFYLGLPPAQTHANIRSRRPVQCAGWASVRNQAFVSLDNWSGHYKPKSGQLAATGSFLLMRGMITEQCLLLPWPRGCMRPKPAAEWRPKASPMHNVPPTPHVICGQLTSLARAERRRELVDLGVQATIAGSVLGLHLYLRFGLR